MTAKEMFEKLGFDCFIRGNTIGYQKVVYDSYYGDDGEKEYERITTIYFFIDRKDITILGHFLTLEVLQAINKQVEELGWYE